MENRPLVSIGMPVYNAECSIRQSLDSLLVQDYDNFELIISDNASTDRTSEICREYVLKDSRIHYFRNETNLGTVKNFNRLVELSNGKYFMWAADHDLWHRQFISKCVSILETAPEIVLVYSQTEWIDIIGNYLGKASDQIDTRGMSLVKRYNYLMWNLNWCDMTYGLMRRHALNQTGMFRNLWGPDHLLLAELALQGTFAQIPEPLFYLRQNRAREDFAAKKERTFLYADPGTSSRRSQLSDNDLWFELYQAHCQVLINNTSLGSWGKLKTIIVTMICFRWRFGVRSPIEIFIDRIVKYIIPKNLSRKIRAFVTKIARAWVLGNIYGIF